MRPQVVLADPFGSVDDVRRGLGPVEVDVVAADAIAPGAIPSGAGVVALLVGPETPVTTAHLDALPGLRIVAATSAGTDHVPVEEVTARGAWVTSAAGYCTDEVAEHTIALVTGLLRGTVALDRAVRAGRWSVPEVRPRRVAGSVLGIVGFGAIGRAVAAHAVALGLRVLAYPGPREPAAAGSQRPSATDAGPSAAPATGSRPVAGTGVEVAAPGVEIVAQLGELLARADVVSLHVPARPGAGPVLDAEAIARLRPGAFVVNVARGSVLDTTALGAALRDGRIAGAALDVLPVEPPPPDDPVRAFPHTVLSPHAAWYSAEAAVRPYVWAGRAVADVLAGRVPERVVGRP
ncbi:NAD(P)-dependent oxidoreductase [Cryptosporangium phraense]|uniref:C-terminal binding protein n=1 Tax=Cryptosporangium phraense TaxID=2593070 RepID=A0A545AVR5_9ACTN|nr:NAD(P)-dependent oxidoreductase [Cryptosporangium phraense]TQS45429.1 C-terminal binding protein [Cryptosporangium phraense]